MKNALIWTQRREHVPDFTANERISDGTGFAHIHLVVMALLRNAGSRQEPWPMPITLDHMILTERVTAYWLACRILRSPATNPNARLSAFRALNALASMERLPRLRRAANRAITSITSEYSAGSAGTPR